MHIVEQTRDRLVVEDRKNIPYPRLGFALGFLFTMPLFVAYWNARSQAGSWKLVIVIAVIWTVIAGIYAAIFRTRAAPRIDLDVRSGRARIGRGDVPLDSITSVSLGGDGQLIFYLRGSDETMFPRSKT